MNCPHCGAEVPAGSGFCYACRKRLGGVRSPGPDPGSAPVVSAHPATAELDGAAPFQRPGLVTAIAVLDLLGTLGSLVLAGLLVWAAVSEPAERLPFGLGALVVAIGGLVQLVCGLGLLALKPFARPLQITWAILSICNPLSILVLIYMLRPGVRVLFSGRSAATVSPAERELVQRDTGGGGGVVVAIVAVVVVGFLVVPAVIGIIAAIAIPSLLRAKVSANEAVNRGDAHAVAAAQAIYASSSGGTYAPRLECLVTPATCLPSYSGPELLPAMTAQDRKSGYDRRLVVPAGTSGTSFVYVAVPVTRNTTGTRGFCVDQTGMLCGTSSDNVSALEGLDGSGCPAAPLCEPIY